MGLQSGHKTKIRNFSTNNIGQNQSRRFLFLIDFSQELPFMGTRSHTVTAFQWPPEAELLLLCARTHMEPDTVERVRRVVAGSINWNYLIREAFYHGTLPLLFWNLAHLCPDMIPLSTLNQLRNAFHKIARLNLFLTRELIQLLNLFKASGIRALPYKGPLLAATAYGNLSLRHFSDLDILVSREDMLKAKELLTLRGYKPNLELSPSQEAAYLRSQHDYRFIRTHDGLVVELQWKVTKRLFSFPFDFNDVWSRSEPVALAGAEIMTLRPEDLFLILCVHGAKHRWEQLKWICDIAELVAAYRQKIDWGKVVDRARMLGGERMLLLGLLLAHRFLGAVLPGESLNRIQNDSQVKHLAFQVQEGLFRKSHDPNRLRDEAPVFFFKVRERLRDKLGVLWKYFPKYFLRTFVPNSKDHAFLPLPSFLFSSYYLVRPVRLIWEHWFNFLHRNKACLFACAFSTLDLFG
jgi:Uncharacterised nucleotidyltransferase